MKLYIYADESGAFDKVNNDLFVYGGVIAVGKQRLTETSAKYLSIEKSIRNSSDDYLEDTELKGCRLSWREEHRLFRAIGSSGCLQFGVIINQKRLYDHIFVDKCRKQQFLDYALKRGIKEGVVSLINSGTVEKRDIDSISVVVDEHSSSTSGIYNLQRSIDEEMRIGMCSPDWNTFHNPVFSPEFPRTPVSYVDSKKVTMVRAADVTANWVFCAERDCDSHPGPKSEIEKHMTLLRLP